MLFQSVKKKYVSASRADRRTAADHPAWETSFSIRFSIFSVPVGRVRFILRHFLHFLACGYDFFFAAPTVVLGAKKKCIHSEEPKASPRQLSAASDPRRSTFSLRSVAPVPAAAAPLTGVAPPPAAAREESLEDIAADIAAEFSDDDESPNLPFRRPLSAKNCYVPKTT